MTDTETLRLLLEEVRAVREDLREHIREEGDEFRAIRANISRLQQDVAVNKSRLTGLVAGIAALVSTAISFMVKAFTQ